MDHCDIATLANKVTEKKNDLRRALILNKCHEKELRENRTFVSEREIALTTQEKTEIMKDAFDFVLRDFPFEDRGGLKSRIGSELSHRKGVRKETTRNILNNAVAKLEQDSKPASVSEKELLEMKIALRDEEECQRAIELLIERGKAVRDANGNIVFFNAHNEE